MRRKNSDFIQNTPLFKLNEIIFNLTNITLLDENNTIEIEKVVEIIIEKETNKEENLETPNPKNFEKKEFNFQNENITIKISEIELKDKIKTYSKLKFYKKIKYDLFTWNGAYSEKNVFFNENKENELKIFYKKSNHLTKEKINNLILFFNG